MLEKELNGNQVSPGLQPGAWHRDLGLPERARQRANPASMAMAGNNCRQISTCRMPGSPAIARL
jgi:hypothetical protein